MQYALRNNDLSMQKTILLLLGLSLFLIGCGAPAGTNTGQYQGAMFENLPLLEGSQAATNTQVGAALHTIGLIHRETVRNPQSGYFIRDSELIDTMDDYETAMYQLGWGLVDVLEFGNGGFVRRYHRDNERAVLAFHSHTGGGTEFVLLQGEVQN
jgi:hypothetical protein